MITATILVALAVPSAASAQVSPGKWEIVTTIHSVDMPNAPPFVADMMKGKPIKVSHCLTPAEAVRGPQDLMKSRKECTFTRYSMVGGKLDSVMVCKQSGGTMTSTSRGSFTLNSFTTTGRSVATGAQPITMTATAIGRRVGECK
ncbi:DUF3617 domain-containing protein [Sphingomonas antarctica]|uniref:DUF3617 domain-containing protein n=1 Tax=Sphingomonas antarctica TaxID=2040274 RepID=UPI0039ECFA9C